MKIKIKKSQLTPALPLKETPDQVPDSGVEAIDHAEPNTTGKQKISHSISPVFLSLDWLRLCIAKLLLFIFLLIRNHKTKPVHERPFCFGP